MSLLIVILVAVIIFVCALTLVDMLPVAGNGKQIIKILLILFALVWLLQNFVVHAGGYYVR